MKTSVTKKEINTETPSYKLNTSSIIGANNINSDKTYDTITKNTKVSKADVETETVELSIPDQPELKPLDPTTVTYYDSYSTTGAKKAGKCKSLWSSIKELGSNVYDMYEKVKVTFVVGGVAVTEGLIDIADNISDGVLSKVAALMDLTGAEAAAAKTREIATYDWANELDNYLYNEENGLLRDINEKSLIKHDGRVAKFLRDKSRFLGEVAAATICPSTALVLVLGFLSGSGKAAEKRYKNTDENGEYKMNLKDEVLINISGVLGALSWVANQKLGQGVVNLHKAAVTEGKTFLQVMKEIGRDVGSVRFLKSMFKNQLTGLTGATNVLNTGFAVAPDVMDYLTGDKKVTVKNVMGTVAKGGLYLLTNILTSELKSYIKNPLAYQSMFDKAGNPTETLAKELDRLEQGDYSKIMSYSPDQQRIILDELMKKGAAGDDQLYELFFHLKPTDADKLLKNLSEDDREKEIVSKLASQILLRNGEVHVGDLDDFGNNFQKYILLKFPDFTQKELAEEAADLYMDGKLSADDLRILIDPKDDKTRGFIENFINRLTEKEGSASKFQTDFQIEDFQHEFGKILENWLKPLSKTAAKTVTDTSKTNIISRAFDNLMSFFNPSEPNHKAGQIDNGEAAKKVVNSINTMIRNAAERNKAIGDLFNTTNKTN